MRTAFVSLIALSAVAGVAMAQDAAPPAAAPENPSATTAAPPAPEAVAPAPEAAAPAGTPEAPPTLPTSGDGAEIISFLEKVCVPAVEDKGKLEDLAKSYGMKLDRRSGNYTIRMGGQKNYNINLVPSGANPNVCWAQVHYAVDQSLPIVSALNIWSYLHQPELKPQRRDYSVDATNKRVTSSWEYYDDKVSTGLVFVELRNPDGTPMNAKYDTATLQYSERKL